MAGPIWLTMTELEPLIAELSVPVTVSIVPAMMLVVKETVASPLASVVLVGAAKEPEQPGLVPRHHAAGRADGVVVSVGELGADCDCTAGNWQIIARHEQVFAATPTTSVSVPRFEALVTPTSAGLAVRVKFPLASGVPAVGRTRTFCQVNVFASPLLTLLTLRVKVPEVGASAMVVPLGIPLMLLPSVTVSPDTITEGSVPSVSNSNPAGAFRTRVPTFTSPAWIPCRRGL